jgi:hypothetical protein
MHEKPVHVFPAALSPDDSGLPSSVVVGDRVAAVTSAEEGTIMQTRLRWERRVQLAVGVALCAALWASSAQAFTEDDQRQLCTGDVFRLCSSEIPDRERIIACMRHKRAQLSQGCRSVFGKPAQSASVKESGWGWR